MSNSRPTNSDIVKLMTMNHEETATRLQAVETQVKYTNGQVRDLQQWRSNTEAVERYRKEAQRGSNPKDIDWQKILLVLLGLLGTALTIISTTAGK